MPSGDVTGEFAGSGQLSGGALAKCADCELRVEVDHRIANHLAMLRSYVHLKDRELEQLPAQLSRDALHLVLASVDAQITAIAKLHRALSSGGENASTDLGEQLHATCAAFAAGLTDPSLIVEDLEPGCRVAVDQMLPLTQMVAEAITNALKHAIGPAGRGGILVRCRKDPLGGLLIEVADEGDGLPAGFDMTMDGGLGFRLMRALARQVGGTLACNTTLSGLRLEIALPSAAPVAAA